MDKSSQEQVYRNFQQMTVNEEDVNILLLGETGVGKSTFINSFANYLEYNKFHIAEKLKVRCLIPAKFTVTDENFEEKVVTIGRDDNENDTMTASATMETRSYVFPMNKNGINRIRLIDTPGIGDTRGIDKDNENMENILAYISNLENLHAICFLLKPNNARLTVMFHYCIKQLLSRLDKSASNNIIFLFTNTRSTFYKPGDTTTALKEILKDIKSNPPHTEIKFGKDNVFCLDNESFRYMVAIKNRILLGNKDSFSQSWDHSVKECWRMIYFITGKGDSTIKVSPHKVKDTLSVNEARRVILQLSKPLADIADLINDNLNVLERQNKSLQADNLSIADLKKNLYVPVINLRCKELSQPTTVCTATKCCEIYTVHNIKKYHYKQRCHDPCYLTNVPKEIIGSPEIVNCWAMTNRKCRICSCDFSTHMHIYYISETYEDRIDNEGVKAQIKDRETALKETTKMITKIEARKSVYEQEKDTIIKTMAKFAHFLQRNAIAPYNDAYRDYIEYLIDREKSMGEECDAQVIRYLSELLNRYNEEKRILDEALSMKSPGAQVISAQSVFEAVQSLFLLPKTGKQIKDLYTRQIRNQNMEHKNTEVVLDEIKEYTEQRNNEGTKSKKKNQKNKKQWTQNPPSNNQRRNKNFNQPQQNIPDLRYLNFQGSGQRNDQYFQPPNMPNQHQFYNSQFQQKYGYSKPSENYSQHNPRQTNYQHQPTNNFAGQPINYANYFGNQNPNNRGGSFPYQNPNQHGTFPNYPGQHFPNQQVPQPITSDYPGKVEVNPFNPSYSGSNNPNAGNLPNQSGQPFLNPQRPRSGNFAPSDPKFDQWFNNIVASSNSSSSNPQTVRHNNYSIRQYTDDSSDDSDDSSGSDTKCNESEDDDEEFKDFLRENGLNNLVKPSSYNNANNKKPKKTNKGSNRSKQGSLSEQFKHTSPSKSEKKGVLGNILSQFF